MSVLYFPVIGNTFFWHVLLGAKHHRSQIKRNWITAYKNTVFIACLKAHDSTAMKNDVSEALNFDQLANFAFIAHAESLGKAFYQTIIPSTLEDLRDRSNSYPGFNGYDSVGGANARRYNKT